METRVDGAVFKIFLRPSATAECIRSIRQADAVGPSHKPTLRGGIEAIEKQIGVGDRRFLAAAAVADRTGTGSRALRTDLQDAGAVDAGDRAATRPDGMDIDH